MGKYYSQHDGEVLDEAIEYFLNLKNSPTQSMFITHTDTVNLDELENGIHIVTSYTGTVEGLEGTRPPFEVAVFSGSQFLRAFSGTDHWEFRRNMGASGWTKWRNSTFSDISYNYPLNSLVTKGVFHLDSGTAPFSGNVIIEVFEKNSTVTQLGTCVINGEKTQFIRTLKSGAEMFTDEEWSPVKSGGFAYQFVTPTEKVEVEEDTLVLRDYIAEILISENAPVQVEEGGLCPIEAEKITSGGGSVYGSDSKVLIDLGCNKNFVTKIVVEYGLYSNGNFLIDYTEVKTSSDGGITLRQPTPVFAASGSTPQIKTHTDKIEKEITRYVKVSLTGGAGSNHNFIKAVRVYGKKIGNTSTDIWRLISGGKPAFLIYGESIPIYGNDANENVITDDYISTTKDMVLNNTIARVIIDLQDSHPEIGIVDLTMGSTSKYVGEVAIFTHDSDHINGNSVLHHSTTLKINATGVFTLRLNVPYVRRSGRRYLEIGITMPSAGSGTGVSIRHVSVYGKNSNDRVTSYSAERNLVSWKNAWFSPRHDWYAQYLMNLTDGVTSFNPNTEEKKGIVLNSGISPLGDIHKGTAEHLIFDTKTQIWKPSESSNFITIWLGEDLGDGVTQNIAIYTRDYVSSTDGRLYEDGGESNNDWIFVGVAKNITPKNSNGYQILQLKYSDFENHELKKPLQFLKRFVALFVNGTMKISEVEIHGCSVFKYYALGTPNMFEYNMSKKLLSAGCPVIPSADFHQQAGITEPNIITSLDYYKLYVQRSDGAYVKEIDPKLYIPKVNVSEGSVDFDNTSFFAVDLCRSRSVFEEIYIKFNNDHKMYSHGSYFQIRTSDEFKSLPSEWDLVANVNANSMKEYTLRYQSAGATIKTYELKRYVAFVLTGVSDATKLYVAIDDFRIIGSSTEVKGYTQTGGIVSQNCTVLSASVDQIHAETLFNGDHFSDGWMYSSGTTQYIELDLKSKIALDSGNDGCFKFYSEYYDFPDKVQILGIEPSTYGDAMADYSDLGTFSFPEQLSNPTTEPFSIKASELKTPYIPKYLKMIFTGYKGMNVYMREIEIIGKKIGVGVS